MIFYDYIRTVQSNQYIILMSCISENNMKNIFLLLYMFGFVLFFRVQPLKAQEAIPPDSLVTPEKTTTTLYEVKPTKYITGSVSQISGDEVANIPGVNRLNALAGRMTGISYANVDGWPGIENSVVKIRGEHTFRGGLGDANRTPLVLIDGKVDDYTLVDPYDIESIVFLKDAASCAMYGLRSANGLILINTKKGKEGRTVVSLNTETSFSQPTRLPKYLDAFNYATLYNEALLNDNPNAAPRYDAAALEGYRTGRDPYKYPNVNWADEFLRKNYVLTRTNINLRGGGDVAKYYVAASYLYNSGVFNVDKDANTYNTNTTATVMNIHSNLQLKIGKKLLIDADIRGKKDVRNLPGECIEEDSKRTNTKPILMDSGRDLLNNLYSLPFNAHPVKNMDGSVAGTNDYQDNPYGYLNLRGYSILERSSISSYLNMAYDLSDWVKGLSIEGRAGFNTYTDYFVSRTKDFAVFQMDADGETYTQYGVTSDAITTSGGYMVNYRNFDHYIGLRYSGDFNQHHVDALLMYDRQQAVDARVGNFTKNFQGPKGSVSYRFNSKYLADFVFSYQGSEQYPKGNRFGFFPAVSAGWIISNESFMTHAGFIDFLKIRGSYGLTGNQVDTYFVYLETWGGAGNHTFGVNPTSTGGWAQTRIANPLLGWEKCLKTNAGLDFAFFENRFSGTFDYFIENTKDILVQGAITEMFGEPGIFMPTGKLENKGYEIQLGWSDRVQDFSYFIGVNYSFAENKIVYRDEQIRNHPWMYRTGYPVDSRFGLVFDRYFTENDDITSLPNQSAQGAQQTAGDLKYADLNNDHVIDANDEKMIGNPVLPTTNYGINFGAQFKGFDVSVFFHGARGGTRYCSGVTYWDFNDRLGNVLEHHLDRWQPGSGQDAAYPRLSLNNQNNYAPSSYWVKDNSFIRLKYIEIGYTLPAQISQKVGMSKARIFVNGNNLFCWDKTGVTDPELKDDGLTFPVQRTLSVGLNISF